jgi:hypothetical protein
MKVILNTLAAGPQGVKKPGEMMELPDRDAAAMVESGQAEYLNSANKTEVVAPETMTNEEAQEAIDKGEAEIPEAAIIEPEEKAVMPKAKPKGKRKSK